MGITETLAGWAAETPEIESALALSRARDGIYDAVACMVAGAGDEGAAVLRSTVARYGAGGATVFGSPEKSPAPWAALANGMAAHALDFDDNYHPGLTHASAVLVPALLALAEETDASGGALVDAYIVGLEIHGAIGRGFGRNHYDLGWHSTATVGCIGTAAACGRLLGLDRRAMANAISLGVSMASGAKAQFGSMGKPFHAGMAAQNAVLAAQLAADGFQARPDAIEGQRGFCDLYAGTEDRDWTEILAALGAPLDIEAHGLAPKLYPCCGSAHRVLDAVLGLRAAEGFAAEDVAAVNTRVGYGNKRNLCYDDPTQEMEARFSMNYCVAVALLFGRVSLSDFTPDAVHRPEVRALLPLVSMAATEPGAEGDDPTKRLPHEVTIELRDGRVLQESVLWPRGTIHNPFDEADLAAKFRDCCEGFLSAGDLETVQEQLRALQTLPSVRALTRHLGFVAGVDHGERFAARYAAAAQ